jgi:PTH1 family peptidyl-tRNA hydrolase
MWLIAGLGNPDPEYRYNRHNVGFMAADALHRRYGFPAWKKKFRSEVSEGKIGAAEKVLLLKPQTFMNLSGEAVKEAASFYKIPSSNVVALYDELDLPLGKMKLKRKGGAGGHNGVKSLESHLGTDEFLRIRIGIGHPGIHEPNKGSLVHDYVLSDFAKYEEEKVETVLNDIAESFEKFVNMSFGLTTEAIIADLSRKNVTTKVSGGN